MDYWRLCDELTLPQAVLLIIGLNPSAYQNRSTDDLSDKIENFHAILTALTNRVKNKLIPANVDIEYSFTDELGDSDLVPDRIINWDKTTILVDDLRSWLKERGVTEGFFFPESKDEFDYLDCNHEHYAPKLAAAVRVWQAVNSDSKLSSGKSIKKAMIGWLVDNANELGLTKEDGTHNNQGIEEIAKVSNWQDKGGAPKTPGS
jgi:hypothetical protein